MSNNITQVEVVNGSSLPDVGSDNFTLYGVNNSTGASGKVGMDRVVSSLMNSNHVFSQEPHRIKVDTIDLAVCDAEKGNCYVFVNDFTTDVTKIKLGTGVRGKVKSYKILCNTDRNAVLERGDNILLITGATSFGNLCMIDVVVFDTTYILNIQELRIWA